MVLRRHDKLDDARKQQLLELYWNRADVKRELNRLRAQRFELLEKVEDQEQAIAHAREQLNGLERLLTNPAAAANAMVYFQLRHLWRVAAQRLEQLGSELERQRTQRERRELHEAALAKRKRRLDAIRANVATFLQKLQKAEQETEHLEQRYARINRLLRPLIGRKLRSSIAELRERKSTLDQQVAELKELSDKIQGEPLPEPEGLSIESRRMINTALIALAQHLVVHFADNDLGNLAKEATERTVADMKFGDRRECDRMVERIRMKIFDLKREEELGERIKERANQLFEEVLYANGADVVPSAQSVPAISPVLSAKSKGRRSTDAPLQVNVLTEDYWDLYSYLR
jgi:hypothetical protein